MRKIETRYIVAIIISLIIGLSILGLGYFTYKYKKTALELEQQKIDQAKAQQYTQYPT